MKTLLKLITALTLSFVFIACGGGGTSAPPASDGTAKGINIAVCQEDSYKGYIKATIIKSETKLQGTIDNAKVRIWHGKDDKRACVVSGTVKAS